MWGEGCDRPKGLRVPWLERWLQIWFPSSCDPQARGNKSLPPSPTPLVSPILALSHHQFHLSLPLEWQRPVGSLNHLSFWYKSLPHLMTPDLER